jgi:hypothetical protein
MASLIDYNNKKICQQEANHCFLNSLDWSATIEGIHFKDYDQFVTQVEGGFKAHPLALTMKANASDNPTWYQAMAVPEKDGYWRVIEVEMETHITKDALVGRRSQEWQARRSSHLHGHSGANISPMAWFTYSLGIPFFDEQTSGLYGCIQLRLNDHEEVFVEMLRVFVVEPAT